jgi:hypothetical protein
MSAEHDHRAEGNPGRVMPPLPSLVQPTRDQPDDNRWENRDPEALTEPICGQAPEPHGAHHHADEDTDSAPRGGVPQRVRVARRHRHEGLS